MFDYEGWSGSSWVDAPNSGSSSDKGPSWTSCQETPLLHWVGHPDSKHPPGGDQRGATRSLARSVPSGGTYDLHGCHYHGTYDAYAYDRTGDSSFVPNEVAVWVRCEPDAGRRRVPTVFLDGVAARPA